MKKTFGISLGFFAILLFSFVACNDIGKGYTGKEKKEQELSYANRAMKDFATVNIEHEVKFKMGKGDDKDASVKSSFKIGKHEITRELWAHVYEWATQQKDNENRKLYKFSNKMKDIGKVTSYKNEPVAYVSYLDAVVWCNAFTEYLNYVHKDDSKWTHLYPVYYEFSNDAREDFSKFVVVKEGERRSKYAELLEKWILREVKEPTDSSVPTSSATGMEVNEFYQFNGYRLPTVEEWEFASRLTKTQTASYDTSKSINIDGTTYYLLKGACLSGSIYTYDDVSPQAQEANKKVASLFDKLLTGPLSNTDNPPSVATKDANDIGCFDMSGGVWEWTLPEEDRHIVLKKSGKAFILDEGYPSPSNSAKGINRIKGGSYISKETEEYAVGYVGKFPMKSDDKDKTKWQRKDVGFRLAKNMRNFF